MFNFDYVNNEDDLVYDDYLPDHQYSTDNCSFYADFSLIPRNNRKEERKNTINFLKNAGLITAGLGGAALSALAMYQQYTQDKRFEEIYKKLKEIHEQGENASVLKE